MRNKQKDFPIRKNTKLHPKAKAENSSLRANGTINSRPQQRMHQAEGDNHEPL